jgi:hypothetical protein
MLTKPVIAEYQVHAWQQGRENICHHRERVPLQDE